MKFSNSIFLSSTLAILTGFPIESNAFAFQPLNSIAQPTKSPFLQASKLHFYDNHFKSPSSSSTIRTKLYTTQDDQDDQDNEIERLKAMAAQLRSEAAKLEVEKAESLAKAAEKAFQSFDTNNDGQISLSELKAGLEKAFKVELSDKRVEELMQAFDISGDGALQLDEFVTESVFRSKLEALVREEKEVAAEKETEAKLAAEAQALAEARLNFLNEKPPTTSDKLVSIIPYLFPLMDGLQYGRFIFTQEQSNPFVIALAVLYALYRSIPFSGFAAFLALNFLSNNPKLNRLVRFNMQQAIFVDIALFFPGLLSGLYGLILKGIGVETAPGFTEIFSDAIFATLLLSLAYCTASSLFGVEPDKLPLISESVTKRMPTIDMFDEEGRFVPREFRDEEEENKDDKKN